MNSACLSNHLCPQLLLPNYIAYIIGLHGDAFSYTFSNFATQWIQAMNGQQTQHYKSSGVSLLTWKSSWDSVTMDRGVFWNLTMDWGVSFFLLKDWRVSWALATGWEVCWGLATGWEITKDSISLHGVQFFLILLWLLLLQGILDSWVREKCVLPLPFPPPLSAIFYIYSTYIGQIRIHYRIVHKDQTLY